MPVSLQSASSCVAQALLLLATFQASLLLALSQASTAACFFENTCSCLQAKPMQMSQRTACTSYMQMQPSLTKQLKQQTATHHAMAPPPIVSTQPAVCASLAFAKLPGSLLSALALPTQSKKPYLCASLAFTPPSS